MVKKLLTTEEASKKSNIPKSRITALCRSDVLACHKVGGAWMVSQASLDEYKKTAKEDRAGNDEKVKKCYASFTGNVKENAFTYDGIEYISSGRAADMTGYNQDYIGELARECVVPARKVGRTWFVARSELLDHKEEKDELLRAVQAESSGVAIQKEESASEDTDIVRAGDPNFSVKYVPEELSELPKQSEMSDSIKIHTEPTEELGTKPLKTVSRINDDIRFTNYGDASDIKARSLHQHTKIATTKQQKTRKKPKKHDDIYARHRYRYGNQVYAFLVVIAACVSILGVFSYGYYSDFYGMTTYMRDAVGHLVPGKVFLYEL